MIQCPSCQNPVAETAFTCIHCGHPMKETSTNKLARFGLECLIIIGVLILLVIAFLAFFGWFAFGK
jgi:hypothetical protein